MKNKFHEETLDQIKAHADTSTSHTFLDSYLGNTHPRYPINAPSMRSISKNWMRSHWDLTANEFQALLTSLVEGVSSTEKVMAGLLMEYATADQREFDP